MRAMRAQLVTQPSLLSQLAEILKGRADAPARRETLQWLDLCTQAANDQGESFLPLRGHLFQGTVSGLWACANSACSGRTGKGCVPRAESDIRMGFIKTNIENRRGRRITNVAAPRSSK